MNNNKKPGEPLEPERWAKIEKEVQELKRSRSILSIGLFLLSGLYGILILCIILRIIRIEDTLTSIIQFNALVGEHTPIADCRRCEPKAIQSAVRRAAKGAWLTNPEYVQQLAGYPLTGAPSAVQFIEMLYNALVRAA